MLVNDHQSARQLVAAERRVTWELRLYGRGDSIRSHSGGESAFKRRPQHRMASRVNSFPYGLALSGAPLSGALGDVSGLIDGEPDEDGESDELGDGVAITGKALAITVRILAIVAGVRYAG